MSTHIWAWSYMSHIYDCTTHIWVPIYEHDHIWVTYMIALLIYEYPYMIMLVYDDHIWLFRIVYDDHICAIIYKTHIWFIKFAGIWSSYMSKCNCHMSNHIWVFQHVYDCLTYVRIWFMCIHMTIIYEYQTYDTHIWSTFPMRWFTSTRAGGG